MSTPIWDQGDVAACVCAQHCHRCKKRGRCVQLFAVGPQLMMNLCLECFLDLARRVGLSQNYLLEPR